MNFPPEAKDRGNRIIARLCGNSQRDGGNKWCAAPLKCEDYPEEHGR